jgi:hypothetical protein
MLTAAETIDEMLRHDLDELDTRKCSSSFIKSITLKLEIEQIVKLPMDCKILTVLIDAEGIKLYVEVDNEVKHYIDRKFAIYADEQFFHANNNRAYIGTMQRYMMPTIHLYELLGD